MRPPCELGQAHPSCSSLASSSTQRNYIILYLAMAALSITTVIFSLMGDCPPLAFYVLEVIVNGVMILEVAIRVVAFGKVSLCHLRPGGLLMRELTLTSCFSGLTS